MTPWADALELNYDDNADYQGLCPDSDYIWIDNNSSIIGPHSG